MSEVKRTERGWPAHFICAYACMFRRNTLLELGKKKIVVSTVGNMRAIRKGEKGLRESEAIGCDRYYETMVFRGKYEKPYWEANVLKQIYFDAPWAIDKVDRYSDAQANAMHEAVVKEITGKMERGEL